MNNYCSQLVNIQNMGGVKRVEIHTSEPFLPGPSHFEIEVATAKLRKYKSILAELIQADQTLLVSDPQTH
jgi:hypothetical protein